MAKFRDIENKDILSENNTLSDILMADKVKTENPSASDKPSENANTKEVQVAANTDFDGSLIEYILEDVEEEIAEKEELVLVADVQTARQMADIEPSQGESNTSPNSNSGGYGFQSSVDKANMLDADAIGALDATELEYGIEFKSEELLFVEPPMAPVQSDPLAPRVFRVGENVSDNDASTTSYRVSDGFGTVEGTEGRDVLFGDAGAGFEPNVIVSVSNNMVIAQDLTGSFRGDLPYMRTNVSDLLAEDLFQDWNIAVTSYQDYGDGNPYTLNLPFRNVADSKDEIQAAIDNFSAGGGGDTREAQFAAMKRILEDSDLADSLLDLGVTDGSMVINLITDAPPHYNGDRSTPDDRYPTLEEMANAIKAAGAQLVVLATRNVMDDYEEFITTYGIEGTVVELASDSENYLDALVEGFSELGLLNGKTNAGADDIVAGEGDDIIFGDMANTDALNVSKSLGLLEGSGWDVFTHLENNDASWSHSNTVNYILSNLYEVSKEVVSQDGNVRGGGADTIDAGEGNDLVFGQEGADTINGGDGNDKLYGGSGSDTLNGDAGNDLLFGDMLYPDRIIGREGDISAFYGDYNKDGKVDAADYSVWRDNLGSTTDLNADGNGDGTVDSSDLEIWRNNYGREIAEGEAGGLREYTDNRQSNDVLNGGEGNDTLVGGRGDNVLTGDEGADLFVLSHLGQGVDTLRDFDATEGDVLNISHILGTETSVGEALTDFVSARREGNDTILSFDADGAGTEASPIDFAVLENTPTFDLATALVNGSISTAPTDFF